MLSSALNDRSASLPQSAHIYSTSLDNVRQRPGEYALLSMDRRRKGTLVNDGDVSPSSRLERVRNLEVSIRKRKLEASQGDYGVARQVLSEFFSNDDVSFDSHPKSKMLWFLSKIQELAGPGWKRTCHSVDIEFMFELYKGGDIQRMLNRVFPRKDGVTVAHYRSERSNFIVDGPINDLVFRKHKAIQGQALTVQPPLAIVTETETTQKPSILMRYHHCKSLVPVPTMYELYESKNSKKIIPNLAISDGLYQM
jgi:hypothetical protein